MSDDESINVSMSKATEPVGAETDFSIGISPWKSSLQNQSALKMLYAFSCLLVHEYKRPLLVLGWNRGGWINRLLFFPVVHKC